MNEIIERTIRREMEYDGTVILTYRIQYPEIISSNYEYGKQAFNQYNQRKALELKEYSETQLYQEAIETYEYNKKNGYPIMVYEVVLEYTITYNQEYIVSLYSDEYIFTGGAHGSTIRKSQNWDLQAVRQIPLMSFFPNNPYYIIDILKEINKQIQYQEENGLNQYFENYCQLVLENFKLENYYITPNYITIFFQQYDIAPYSSGIPIFKIPIRQ